MITEAGSLITTPCYLTCTVITEAGSLLATPCYLTCTMIKELGSLLTRPCYITLCNNNGGTQSAYHTLLPNVPLTIDRHSLPKSKLNINKGYKTDLRTGRIIEEVTVFVAFIHHCDSVLHQSLIQFTCERFIYVNDKAC